MASGDPEVFGAVVDGLEQLGFDSLWVAERASGPALDPIVAMTFAAARTTHLKFGPSVMVLPGRNPVLLAKTMASLDRISNGRLLPAFGLGVADTAEHQAFGVARMDRAAWFNEALPLMRRLWTEDVVEHHGPRFHLDAARVDIKPVQQPLDVWMGGIAPSELRRVGRLSDGWLPSFVTPRMCETASPRSDSMPTKQTGKSTPNTTGRCWPTPTDRSPIGSSNSSNCANPTKTPAT